MLLRLFERSEWHWRRTLDRVVKILRTFPEFKLRVLSQDDSQGALSASQELMEKRARTVVSYFAARGVPLKKLTIDIFDDSLPKTLDPEKKERIRKNPILFVFYE